MVEINRSLAEIPIENLLPHREPMILLDCLIGHEEDTTVCLSTIHPGMPFFHEGRVPAHMGIELMAQTIAVHAGYPAYLERREPVVGFLLGSPKLETAEPFFEEGRVLRVEAHQVWGEAEMLQFACSLYDDGDDRQIQVANVNIFKPKDLWRYLAEAKR